MSLFPFCRVELFFSSTIFDIQQPLKIQVVGNPIKLYWARGLGESFCTTARGGLPRMCETDKNMDRALMIRAATCAYNCPSDRRPSELTSHTYQLIVIYLSGIVATVGCVGTRSRTCFNQFRLVIDGMVVGMYLQLRYVTYEYIKYLQLQGFHSCVLIVYTYGKG